MTAGDHHRIPEGIQSGYTSRAHGAGRPSGGHPPQATSWLDAIAPAPWGATAGCAAKRASSAAKGRTPLYTPEQRERRDRSVWTIVQGVLAPIQFLVFLASVVLVVRYLATGDGHAEATVSVVVKTFILYAIMVTGSIWEKVVFGKWLFAEPFFWEDVFSMAVLALHTAYLGAVLFHVGTPAEQMWLALAAYATYVVNAGQFLWKLREARLEAGQRPARGPMTGAPA